MDHNERFNQLENLMTDMLRHMDQFNAALEHTNHVLDSVVEVIKIADQRFEKVEEILLRHDEQLRLSDERQNATLRLLMQQSENLTAAFRTLESHDGRIQKPFVVRSATTAPWFWAGTGLADGGTFGEPLGGYGIEIDTTTPHTPPGTIVLAEVPDLYGPGLTAQMTYYETAAGAKVFAAGTLGFGGSDNPVGHHLFTNLWAHLTQP